ncbi:MAG: glycosyltransferase family 2 protein, partial [Candidatus Methanomethylophilaceae archaeon]
MNVDGAVTGVIVSYNGEKILKTTINSIRKFHPDMNLIIVDGSDVNDGCYKYIQKLPDQRTKVYHVSRNIGHGRGLVLGISYVQTPFFLTIDSDIEMLKSPLQDMLDMMEDDTCVVGYVENIDREGNDYGARPDLMQYG